MFATAEEDKLAQVDIIAYPKRKQLAQKPAATVKIAVATEDDKLDQEKVDVEKIVTTEEAEKLYQDPAIAEEIVAADEETNTVKGPVDTVEMEAAPEEDESTNEMVGNEEPVAVTQGGSDLIPDYLTPTIILVGVNIIVPTLHLYRDLTMITRLFNAGYSEYYGWTSFLLLGLLINFFFISLAWWRLESAADKRWSWLLLLLQVWPQSRALKVIWLLWTGDPSASQEKARLDREVGGLEPFLEAFPTALAVYYLAFYRQS